MAFIVNTDHAIRRTSVVIDAVQRDFQAAQAFKDLSRNAQRSYYDIQSALVNKDIDAMWRADGRQVLSIDPDLADALGQADGEIVTEALLAMPYRSPMISFPVPIQVASDPSNGTTGHLAGVYVVGRASHTEQEFCSTHEPGVSYFLLLMVVEVRDHEGPTGDYDMVRITVPISSTPVALSEVIRRVLERGAFSSFSGSSDPDEVSAYLGTTIGYALSALLYLCATTFDATAVPASHVKRRWSASSPGKPPVVLKVGWKVGPALSKARRAASESNRGATGISRSPHAVRAHFKTVWTGKGRTVPKVAFIAPYMTGVGDLEATTLHPVRAE